MFTNGTRTVGFVDPTIDHFHTDLVIVGPIPFAFTDSPNRITSAMLPMKQMLFDVLESTVELRLTNPAMDDAFRYRAVAIESAMLSRHGFRCFQGSLHNV